MQAKTISRRAAMAIATALLIAVLPAAEALAHAHLKSSTPTADATVAAPTSLKLSFNERVEPKFSGVNITGPDKAAIKTGDAAIDPKDGNTLVIPISETLKAGTYSVDWHALSADGHKVKGSFAFTVKP